MSDNITLFMFLGIWLGAVAVIGSFIGPYIPAAGYLVVPFLIWVLVFIAAIVIIIPAAFLLVGVDEAKRRWSEWR